jgi:hypothetical protein
LYWWTRVEAAPPDEPGTGFHWLLVRWNRKSGEKAYYLCHSPGRVRLGALVRVAGLRWRVEESFQQSKELAGLDQHQVRRWDSFNRWITLAMWAYALVVAVTLTVRARDGTHPGMVRHSVNEVRRLLTAGLPRRPAGHALAWSYWRRRHQWRARQSHYRRRLGGEMRL